MGTYHRLDFLLLSGHIHCKLFYLIFQDFYYYRRSKLLLKVLLKLTLYSSVYFKKGVNKFTGKPPKVTNLRELKMRLSLYNFVDVSDYVHIHRKSRKRIM